MDLERSVGLKTLLCFPLGGGLSKTEEAVHRLLSVYGFDHIPISLEVAGNPRERFPLCYDLSSSCDQSIEN